MATSERQQTRNGRHVDVAGVRTYYECAMTSRADPRSPAVRLTRAIRDDLPTQIASALLSRGDAN